MRQYFHSLQWYAGSEKVELILASYVKEGNQDDGKAHKND